MTGKKEAWGGIIGKILIGIAFVVIVGALVSCGHQPPGEELWKMV